MSQARAPKQSRSRLLATVHPNATQALEAIAFHVADVLQPHRSGEPKNMERTLVLLKPDAVQRRMMGRIIARFEDKGLNIVAMKMLRVTQDLARQHYAEHLEKPFYPGLEQFITAAPIVAMVVQGSDVVRVVRQLVGDTSGLNAAAGTIRGDFSVSQQKNLVHASDSQQSAAREIELFFDEQEIHDLELALGPWLKAAHE